jgi:hypothetical protein
MEEQIIAALKEHQAGLPVAELYRKHGISNATFSTRRSKYDGREVSDAKRRKLHDLAAERRRFGYRRLLVLRGWDRVVVNHKRLFRSHREERPTVRRQGGRKRALGMRASMTVPQALNQRWSLEWPPTSRTTGEGSGGWWSSTSSAGSAWRRWRAPPCPVAASPGRSNGLVERAALGMDESRAADDGPGSLRAP